MDFLVKKTNGTDKNGPSVSVVENGRAIACIVLPERADDAEKYAANELAAYVKKSTGAILPVESDASFCCGAAISIGKTRLLKQAGLSERGGALKQDGFFIITADDCVYVDGNGPRAVVYGIYELLERFLDIRFLTLESEYVPLKENFIVPSSDIVEEPDFIFRNFLAGDLYRFDIFENSPALALKMRMSNDQVPDALNSRCGWYKSDKLEPNHNILTYVKPELYEKARPEMFSRRKLSGDTTEDAGKITEICWSDGIDENGNLDENMSVSCAKAALKTLLDFAAEQPEAEYFMMGQMDAPAAPCECERCRRRLKKYKTYSGIAVAFVNAVVRAANEQAAKSGRTKPIRAVIFAYNHTTAAPVKKEDGRYVPVCREAVADKNVCVRLAPYEYDYARSISDPLQDPELPDLYEQWAAVCGSIMVWDYLIGVDDYFCYMPYLWVMKPNYSFYRGHNVIYAMTQSNHVDANCFQQKIMLYLASRLMWNTDTDDKAVVEEFLRLEYGAVWEDVKAYMDYMDAFFDRAKKRLPGLKCPPNHRNNAYYGDPSTYDKQTMFEGLRLVRKAIEHARALDLGEEERAALNKKLDRVLLKPLRMIMRNSAAYPAMYDLTPSQLRSVIEEFCEICERVGVEYYASGLTMDYIKIPYNIK